MIKYIILLVSISCFSFNLHAQFISLDSPSGSDVVKPSIETTRSAFLEMNEALQNAIDKFIFTDLIQQTHSLGLEDGKFYLTSEQFYAFNATRKLHIIKNPEQYIVVNTLKEKTPVSIKEADFKALPVEKQKNIIGNSDYIIVK